MINFLIENKIIIKLIWVFRSTCTKFFLQFEKESENFVGNKNVFNKEKKFYVSKKNQKLTEKIIFVSKSKNIFLKVQNHIIQK